LAGATNDVLWDWDIASGRVERNDALRTTFGYSSRDIEATREWWNERVHPDDRAGMSAVIADALGRQSAFTLEYRFRRADGTYATILDRAWVMRDDDGRAVRAVGSCVDVSERKALESDLRRKTERLAAMMELQREIAAASLDLQAALARVAQRAARLAHAEGAAIGRVEHDQLVYGASYGVSFAPQGARVPLHESLAAHVSTTGDALVVWDTERDARARLTLLEGSGVRSLVALPLVAENRLVGVLSVHGASPHVFDSEEVQALTLIGGVIAVAIANSERFSENQRLLAERTAALAAARDSEERYRTVTDGTPLRIACIDSDLRYQFANRALCEAHRRLPEEILGRRMDEILLPSNFQRLQPYVTAVLAGREQHFDVSWDVQGESPRVFSVRYVPRRDEKGAVTGFYVISSDETDRRRLEEQVQRTQRMEAVGQLAGGIAHDFNNLLTVIGGFAQVIGLDPNLRDAQRDDLEEIGKATRRASDLTRRLLAFSRKQTLQPETVDINSIIRDNERMLRRLVGEDIEFACNLATTLGVVFADPRQLEHVFVNLVVNARDATPAGGKITIETVDIDVHAGTGSHVPPGKWVRIRISDTGSGMSQDVLEHAFEPFFTTKPVGEGTGLGLAMVYGIIEQSGGTISAESAVGRGTTFTILLPRTAERTATPAPARPPAARAKGELILIVEDEEPVRLLARRVLERAGYEVLVASNGVEAMAVLQKEKRTIGLIVSDIVMPQMGGLELAERVRTEYPSVRMLFMSGYAAAEIERRGGIPANAPMLQKPFGPEALSHAVRDAMSVKG
jgi:PAS domain S-box-containing protein